MVSDTANAPRTIRCTRAEIDYLKKVLAKMREEGWDPLASIRCASTAPIGLASDIKSSTTTIRKADFGISVEDFLAKNRVPSLIQPEASDTPCVYTWQESEDMLEFERGLNWDFSGINQCYPEIMAEVFKVAGASLCKQAEASQNTNRTLYNDTMEEIYNKWRNK